MSDTERDTGYLLADCVRRFVEGGMTMGGGSRGLQNKYIHCEVGGKPIDGVVRTSLKIDHDGGQCIQLHLDTESIVHTGAGTGLSSRQNEAVDPRRMIANGVTH